MHIIFLILCLAAGPVMAQEDYITFKSPSGNILCGISSGHDASARCDMLSLTPTYTSRPPGCEADWGHSFYIGAYDRMGVLGCVGDVVDDPRQMPVLPYGARLDFGGITCVSEKAGVTCNNEAGHGFSIAKARQQLY